MPRYIKNKLAKQEKQKKTRIARKFKQKLRNRGTIRAPQGNSGILVKMVSKSGGGARRKKGGCPFCG